MTTKKIITITVDYNDDLPRVLRKEAVSEMEGNIYSSNDNRYVKLDGVEYIDDMEEIEGEYETVIARGYSQGDYNEFYTVGVSKEDIELLSREFTHQNSYAAIGIECMEGGRERKIKIDCNSFIITDIEFPEDEEIIARCKEENGEEYEYVYN